MNDDDNKNIINFGRRANNKQTAELSRSEQIHRRRMIAIVSTIVLIVIFFGVQIIQAKLSESQTRDSITTSQKKLKKQNQDNKDLKLKAKQLQSKDYIEKVIRAKYYYSKDDEQIYAIPGSDDIFDK